ncbi:MAG: META domain-containing protein [Phycisphaerales bacterium]|nr:META domain-containing protein [Hyphomonadaceae bacterium]
MIRSLALAFFVIATACAEKVEPPVPAPPPTLQLNGTQWTSAEGALDAPSIEFDGSRANGFTGCNRFFAQVEQNGPALTLTGIGTTRRACSPDLTEIERTFVAQLEGTRAARFEGEALVLEDVNGAEIARFNRRE